MAKKRRSVLTSSETQPPGRGAARFVHALCGRDGRLYSAPRTPWKRNLLMYGAASAIAGFMTTRDPVWLPAGILLEFANVEDPEDSVAAPDYDRGDGIDYYNGLDGSSSDFLRVPITYRRGKNTDVSLYPDNNGAVYLGLTAGMTEGVNGLPFSAGANSKVFGAAIVCILDPDDRTQDLVFSRIYFDAADQALKLDLPQNLGLEWEINFG